MNTVSAQQSLLYSNRSLIEISIDGQTADLRPPNESPMDERHVVAGESQRHRLGVARRHPRVVVVDRCRYQSLVQTIAPVEVTAADGDAVVVRTDRSRKHRFVAVTDAVRLSVGRVGVGVGGGGVDKWRVTPLENRGAIAVDARIVLMRR